jgi:hypothetical protein
MYQSLDPSKIVATAEALSRRVDERFPDSGLGKVIRELAGVTRQAEGLSLWLLRPNRWLRGGVALAIALIIALIIGAFMSLDLNVSLFSSMSDFAQGLESVINDFIFLGLAIYFLATGEARLKRRKALSAIHVLRSMAHIIDMHQLTKDPEQFAQAVVPTPSSPKRSLTPYELTRYLDYCSEALAILSKIAAVYVQHFNDPVTLSAVNDVEELTNGLARKIWQKIMILDPGLLKSGESKIAASGSAR